MVGLLLYIQWDVEAYHFYFPRILINRNDHFLRWWCPQLVGLLFRWRLACRGWFMGAALSNHHSRMIQNDPEKFTVIYPSNLIKWSAVWLTYHPSKDLFVAKWSQDVSRNRLVYQLKITKTQEPNERKTKDWDSKFTDTAPGEMSFCLYYIYNIYIFIYMDTMIDVRG